MTSILAVRYEGSSANLNGVADIDGDTFVNGDLEGLDGMEAELQLVTRHRNGSAFLKGQYPKRELVLKGTGWAPANVSNGVLRVRNKIEAWFSDYLWNERWLYVDLPSPGVPVQMKTRPGGKLHFEAPRANSQAYEVPFTCADPAKYSQTQETINVNGTATLINIGNFPTWITATLVNDGVNPWIQNNSYDNQRITLDGARQAGTTADFYARRTKTPGGGIQEMARRPRIWFPLLPGTNILTSNTNWLVQWRHAFR